MTMHRIAALDLGTVVLVPQTGVGPVEVLAIAALAPIDGAAPSVDDCLGVYQAFLGGADAACAPTEPCAACIFARRSLGFVEYSNLDLTISLDNDCAGVLCEASKTCVAQRGCVSAVVTCDGDSCNEPEGGRGAGPGAVGRRGGSGGEGGRGAGAKGEHARRRGGGNPWRHTMGCHAMSRSQQTRRRERAPTYVAAGDCMVSYDDREMLEKVRGGPKIPSRAAEMAVRCARGSPGRFVRHRFIPNTKGSRTLRLESPPPGEPMRCSDRRGGSAANWRADVPPVCAQLCSRWETARARRPRVAAEGYARAGR